MTRPDPVGSEVRERLAALRERIAGACARSDRDPSEVRLVGVSKRQPDDRVLAAVRAGVDQLGENYVQELRDKRARLQTLLEAEGDHRTVVWRMIGGLQRNKARAVVPLVDAVDSVDRESLARELDRRAGALGRRLSICIQVNLSGEPQKSGVRPEELGALLATCAELEHLQVEGLMTIPAETADPESTRPVFARLRALRDGFRQDPGGATLRELSMGMSGDFEIAIEEGATLIRVGTALFGERPT